MRQSASGGPNLSLEVGGFPPWALSYLSPRYISFAFRNLRLAFSSAMSTALRVLLYGALLLSYFIADTFLLQVKAISNVEGNQAKLQIEVVPDPDPHSLSQRAPMCLSCL